MSRAAKTPLPWMGESRTTTASELQPRGRLRYDHPAAAKAASNVHSRKSSCSITPFSRLCASARQAVCGHRLARRSGSRLGSRRVAGPRRWGSDRPAGSDAAQALGRPMAGFCSQRRGRRCAGLKDKLVSALADRELGTRCEPRAERCSTPGKHANSAPHSQVQPHASWGCTAWPGTPACMGGNAQTQLRGV